MKLLKRGAESEVYECERLGIKAVLKIRIPKRYRHPRLDLKIRRERTLSEARTIRRIRLLGVSVPHVLDVHVDKETFLVLEYVEGKPIAEISAKEVRKRLGYYVGIMHANDEIHGDLNVSNVIVRSNDPVLIDFGLSFKSSRVEDKADDLHTLKRSMLRLDEWQELREAFLEGYRSSYTKADEVIRREREIWLRGRYVERSKGSVRETLG